MAKQIKIEWTPSASNTVAPTSQVVERSATENGTYSVIHTASNNTTDEYIDTTVVDGETWWYKVGAVFASGNTIYLSADDITVSTTSTYEPWNEVNCKLALLSNAALPIDVSQAEDGTGGNPMTTAGSDPTNANGWNQFVSANANYTQLASDNSIALASEAFTDIMYFIPQTLTPSANQVWYENLGAANSINMRSATPDMQLRVGTSVEHIVDPLSDEFAIGVPVLITTMRTAGGLVTIQFNDDTPKTGASQSNGARVVRTHGSQASGVNPSDVHIGRRICFDAALTGTDLANAKQWVLDGNLL